MLSRRDGLRLAGALSSLALGGLPARAAPDAPTVRTPVDFAVPSGAADCHVHVIPDPAAFPFWSGRVYTPPVATAEELLVLQKALHLDHVVIVTPSVYGTDNSATLDGINRLGRTRARGIAVIGDTTTNADLDALQKAGVCGIRINLEQAGVFDPAAAAKTFDAAVERIKDLPWHLQIYSRPVVIETMRKQIERLSIPVVLDHFAGAQASQGVQQPGFGAVLDLVKSGKVYVKVSGAYRASSKAPDYPDVAPLAAALISANPDRLVWGSDWPHPDSAKVDGRKATDLAPPMIVDDGRVLNLLAEWAPDAGVRSKILVDNPKRLYGF